MILATQNGHCELVDFLLQSGADPLVKGLLSQIPLHYATSLGCIVCTKGLLLSDLRAVNVADFYCRTSLHYAANAGFLEGLKLLKEKGALFEQDRVKKTPLHYAAENSKAEAMEMILDLYEPPVDQKEFFNKTANDYAHKTGRQILALRGSNQVANLSKPSKSYIKVNI